MPFEQFPYTNFHELNLDWILDQMKSIKDKTDDIDEALLEAKQYAEQAQAVADTFSDIFITPEMYGAVGDGVTDDSQAFADMLAALSYVMYQANSVESAQQFNYKIILQNKIYCLSDTLALPAGCSFIGQGENNSVLKFISPETYGITFDPINYGEGYLVCKNNEVAGFSIDGNYQLNYGISNINNNCWLQSIKIHDIYITKCNYSGLAIVSCWLSSFVNIKCEVAAIPFIFTENLNNNGFNNNYLENLSADNFTICGMLLSATNCTLNSINVDRAYEYCRGTITATSLVHNGVTYSDKCGIYITKNTDTLNISEIWMEWLADNLTVPAIIVKDITKYGDNTFKALTVTIKDLHLGTPTPLVYQILSGIVLIDGLRADLTGTFSVIDTTGADANTSLTVKNLSYYHAINNSTYTLPYGAVRIDCYNSNGQLVTKQTTYHNMYLDDDNKLNSVVNITEGLEERHFNNVVSSRILTNGMTAHINKVISRTGSQADANGYFDLGFVLPSGYGITGVATARNANAETAVMSAHWMQFMVLGNGNMGVRMTHNNATVTLDSSGTYMFIIEIYKY